MRVNPRGGALAHNPEQRVRTPRRTPGESEEYEASLCSALVGPLQSGHIASLSGEYAALISSVAGVSG